MFNVKMITNKDLTNEIPHILMGGTVYEEDFKNENDINLDDFLGEDFTVYITNLKNGEQKVITR